MSSGLASRLSALLHAPSSGHRMAAFRIAFGVYLFCYLANLAPHIELLFSNQGVQLPYLLPDYAPGVAIAWMLFGAMLVLDVALLLGYRTELAARLLFVLFLYHYFLQLGVKQSSYDRLIAIYLVVLGFADAGRVLGLDALRPGPPPNAWGERMLAGQTLLLYFGSGLWKLFNPDWHTGALLRSNLQGMFASPLAFAIVRLGFSDRTWTIFSWSIVGFELALAPLLLVRRTRALGMLLGLGFHLFNTFVLVIPEFLVAVTPYPVFVTQDRLEQIAGKCAALVHATTLRLRGDATRSPPSSAG